MIGKQDRDEQMERLLDYDGRRFPLENGWAVEFRLRLVACDETRPWGIKYALVLRDVDGTRIMGFDNAHGIPRRTSWDHSHRFRRTDVLVPYDFTTGDALIGDFFEAL